MTCVRLAGIASGFLAVGCIGGSFTANGAGGGSSTNGDASASSTSSASSASSGTMADCDDVAGTFEITSGNLACLAVKTTAGQCIVRGAGCHIQIASSPAGQGVSGFAAVGQHGGFGATAITIGSMPETCGGVWDETQSVMTITCQGAPPCTVALKRTSTGACPFPVE